MGTHDVRLLPGYFDLLIDDAAGRVLLGIREFDEVFLIGGGLDHGLGDSHLPLDRGAIVPTRAARFLRRGRTAFLELLNHAFGGGDPAGTVAGADSFATSIVWQAPLAEAEELRGYASTLGQALPDAAFVVADTLGATDLFDLAGAFVGRGWRGPAAEGRRAPSLQPERSFLETAELRTFPDNTELVSRLSFASSTGEQIGTDVPPDARGFTLVQRISFLRRPTGFHRRAFEPTSGGIAVTRTRPEGIVAGAQREAWQLRFRVPQLAGSAAPGSEPAIVFWVDPDIPQPYLDDIVAGGNWWRAAFEQAGLPGAFEVRVAGAEHDPWLIGHNHVWWVHRNGRGWSLGQAQSDPYTGEILRGNVRLGAQRIDQLRQLFEALLAPYGRADEGARLDAIESAIRQRIRHLAAHEIGHSLGFTHNFASTLHEQPSVLDYPHPTIGFDASGELTLRDAYSEGLGPWDFALVRHVYGDGAGSGLAFLTDADANGPASRSPDAVPWTLRGVDAIEGLRHILAVRAKALAEFGAAALPPGADNGALAERLPAVQLLHRFEVQRVIRAIGGERHRYGPAGVGGVLEPVGANEQQAALDAVLPLLGSEVTAVPSRIARLLGPASPGLRELRGAPPLSTGELAVAAVAVVAAELFDPDRLGRALRHHADDTEVPAPATLLRRALGAAEGVAARTTLLRYALHALHSTRDDAVRAHLDTALREELTRAENDFEAGFLRRGLEQLDRGTLGELFALPRIPVGIPL